MSKHLERDIEALESDLLSMSASVEKMMELAWTSIQHADEQIAQDVIAADKAIDQQEIRIEEECLKILALHQPVAIDLRRTATILKVNNDLERIADLAVNLAERSRRLANHTFPLPSVLTTMARTARSMLYDSLNALVQLDPDAAVDVCKSDDEVDRCHVEVITDLYQAMKQNPDSIAPAIHCMAIARNLERIADHATNIAEDVIYLVRGDIARHQHVEPYDVDSHT